LCPWCQRYQRARPHNSFNFNDKIYVENTTDLRGFQDVFTVQEITFNDYPGNTGLSTATIFAVDGLARAGRYQAVSKALTQTNTYTQLLQFNSSPLPADLVISSGAGSSIASAQTYTGTVLNQINVTQSTERGLISTGVTSPSKTIQVIYPIGRNEIPSPSSTFYSFGRNTSATVIAYNTFERIQNGLSFINTATISPLGLAEQTRTNTASVTAYGATFYSSSTVDYDATQAQGNGDWIVNTFSDIEDLRFRIGFTDRMQNSSAYALFLLQFGVGSYSLAYREPAAVSDTTVNVVLEGWQINITPEQTTYSLSFSPLDYYQFFTLNSSTLGILDTSRLGW